MNTPPICSFVSAKGPSVTMRSPSTTRTTFASVAASSSRPWTSGSAFPISSNSAIQRGIDSARRRAASSSEMPSHDDWSPYTSSAYFISRLLVDMDRANLDGSVLGGGNARRPLERVVEEGQSRTK